LPLIKKRFPNYASYAKARIAEVLPAQQQNAGIVVRIRMQESVWIENTGGSFRIRPLPQLAQWSPIQSLWVEDLDRDGHLDVLAVGNAYDAESIAGQYDAFPGLLLKGDGKGNFEPLLFPQSGFLADGDCKSVLGLKGAKSRTFVVAVNNGPLKIYQLQKPNLSAEVQ
jgi:enediyne biosynthesis protein E4